MKPRLLMIGDHGQPTGFERVLRGIAERLHTTGDFEITVRGIGYDPAEAYRTYPYTVKSWGGTKDNQDPLGVLNFEDWVTEDRPDVVFILQDIWNITNWMPYKPQNLPAVAYYPVDTPNLKPNYLQGLGAISEAVCYTKFGAVESAASVRAQLDEIFEAADPASGVFEGLIGGAPLPHDDGQTLYIRFDRMMRYQQPYNYNIIPHGMEEGVFEPRDKAQARTLWGIPQDAFVVLNVNSNQFRKRMDLTMRAFKLLYEQRKDAFLVIHSMGGDRDGWDLLQLARYFELPLDRVACTHYANPRITDDQLCWLYNTADVQINTAGGEGWGLTSFEGAACGVPQFVPDWSATRELWTGYGALIPVADFRTEARGKSNTMHAVVDIKQLANDLARVAEDAEMRERLVSGALKQTKRQVSWERVGDAFSQVIQKALKEPPNVGVKYDTIMSTRTEIVRSELQGRALL